MESFSNRILKQDLSKYQITNLFDFELTLGTIGSNSVHLELRIVESAIRITGTYKTKITIKNCYFKKKVVIENAIFEEEVTIEKCFFDEDFVIGEDVVFKKTAAFPEVACRKMTITHTKFQECYLSVKVAQNLQINTIELKGLRLEFSGAKEAAKEVNLSDINLDESGDLYLTGLKSELLVLSGISKNLQIHLVGSLISNIRIENYRNEGVLRLIDIGPLKSSQQTKFEIVRSHLGKSEFSNVNLRDFQHIVLEDSNIIDCSFVNVLWNYKITGSSKMPIQNERSKRLYHSKTREIYRQLKYAMSKQGDVINEQRFHGFEMETYDKSLTWRSFWTKLILKLSKITSDFGQSVSKPILSLLIVHFLLFIFLVSKDYFPGITLSRSPDGEGIIKGSNFFFETINPFRRVESRGRYVIIDLAMRIWASYMIYNIIRATRRFIK